MKMKFEGWCNKCSCKDCITVNILVSSEPCNKAGCANCKWSEEHQRPDWFSDKCGGAKYKVEDAE